MNPGPRRVPQLPEASYPNPDPRLVRLINYATGAVSAKLDHQVEYTFWVEWAQEWRVGVCSPAQCVKVARACFSHKGDICGATWHTLGQLAWGAKEACYSTPKSGWLVVRYIADAMIAFGVAYPDAVITAPLDMIGPSLKVIEHERGAP